eukprot:365771-Chlamydomonas_euryale.AAC.6
MVLPPVPKYTRRNTSSRSPGCSICANRAPHKHGTPCLTRRNNWDAENKVGHSHRVHHKGQRRSNNKVMHSGSSQAQRIKSGTAR